MELFCGVPSGVWMRLKKSKALLLFFSFLLSCIKTPAQDTLFQSLSKRSSKIYEAEAVAYRARAADKKFPDSREAQRIYTKLIKERNEALAEMLEEDKLTVDPVLLQRCESVIARLRKANPAYDLQGIKVFIGRSGEPNAFCFGEGTLVVNRGIFLLVENEDELAFIMAHELSHQFLKHGEERYQRQISMRVSKDFKQEVKTAMKASRTQADEYLALKRRLYAEQGEYSRSQELEADSLGLAMCVGAGYDAAKAAQMLLKLDRVDELLVGIGLYDLQKLQIAAPETAKPQRYSGLSGAKVTLTATNLFDSLKRTHPDALLRYTTLLHREAPQKPEAPKEILQRTASPEKGRQLVEITCYYLEGRSIGLALHYALLAQSCGFTDAVFDDLISASLSGLRGAARQGERYDATYVYTPNNCSLRELQVALGKLSDVQLGEKALFFLQKASASNTASHRFATSAYEVFVTGQKNAEAAKTALQPNDFASLIMALSHTDKNTSSK